MIFRKFLCFFVSFSVLIFLLKFYCYAKDFNKQLEQVLKNKYTLSNITSEKKLNKFQKNTRPSSAKTTKSNFIPSLNESFEYSFKYFIFGRFKLKIEAKKIVYLKGRRCLHIFASLEPFGIMKFFKNVKYQAHTYIDTNKDVPVRFQKYKIINNKIVKRETIDFDHRTKVAIWQYTGRKSKRMLIPGSTQDILSSFYYFRKIVKPNSKLNFKILYNGIIWDVDITTEDYRTIKYKGKELDALFVKVESDLISYISKKKSRQFFMYCNSQAKNVPIIFLLNFKSAKVSGILESFSF